ncbi:MAG TPA: acyloxyacyl hydrolase [Thermoanaerobaculia bacterium]|nr:acyloxyacyl hydrolase [Thermoanaerobaculia bacterium]
MRAGAALAVLLLVPAAAQGQDAWRVVALYGQASAPTSQGFAESGALALGREWPLGKGFGLSAELYPLFLVRLTRVDLPERPRETVWAVAASPLLSYTFLPEKARVRIRLEAGVGLFWGFSPVPAQGSRFNFLDQLGALLVFRLDSGSRIAAGLCRFHVSNAHLYGSVDPGLSFYSGAVSFFWPPGK